MTPTPAVPRPKLATVSVEPPRQATKRLSSSGRKACRQSVSSPAKEGAETRKLFENDIKRGKGTFILQVEEGQDAPE